MHRIFIGLPISEKFQTEILNWEKKFSDLPVRWLQGKNLHLTLVPPWYEKNIENLKSLLQAVVGAGSFKVSFRKVVFGPTERQPRLIWAEGETPKELLDLRAGIYRLLGQEPERRPFRLHLTLARFKSEAFVSFPIKQLNEKIGWQDKIDRVVLFESRLSRGGADYHLLAEISL